MKKINIKLQITSVTDYDASFMLSAGRSEWVGGYAIGSDAQSALGGVIRKFFPKFKLETGWSAVIDVPDYAADELLFDTARIYADSRRKDRKMGSGNSYVCTFEFYRVK